MSALTLPSVADIVGELKSIQKNIEGDCDIRLQVYPNSQWAIRWGLSDYDQDHRGYWGACGIDQDSKQSDLIMTAIVLLDQVAEQAATEGETVL